MFLHRELPIRLAHRVKDLDSIPMCMWFIMVTLTTVGYGDVTPQSELGKPFTMFCCFVGVCLVAMPLAVIGNNFVSVHNVYLNATAEKRRGVAEGGSPDRRSSGGSGFASPSFARRKIRNQAAAHRLRGAADLSAAGDEDPGAPRPRVRAVGHTPRRDRPRRRTRRFRRRQPDPRVAPRRRTPAVGARAAEVPRGRRARVCRAPAAFHRLAGSESSRGGRPRGCSRCRRGGARRFRGNFRS